MKRYLVTLALAIVLLSCGGVRAEMYSYTDGQGELHFVDDISKVPKKYRKKLKNLDNLPDVSVMDATPAPKKGAARGEGARPRRSEWFSGTVEMYAADWCPHCRKAEQYMTAKGIPFVKYDIDRDAGAKRRYQELGAGGIPLILIGDKKMNGFSPEALEYRLGSGR